MAIIRITDLRLRCIIGANDWEREKKQDVIINIVMHVDISKPSQSDDLNDTVDYKTIAKKIIKTIEPSEFILLEKMVQVVMDIVCEHPMVKKAEVRIDKPAALRFADSVSVELTHNKSSWIVLS